MAIGYKTVTNHLLASQNPPNLAQNKHCNTDLCYDSNKILHHFKSLDIFIYSYSSRYGSKTSHHHGFSLVRYYFTNDMPLVMVILTALDRTKMSYNLPWVNAAYYKHRLLFDQIKWIDKG